MKRFHVVVILLVATFALCATAQEQKLSAEKRAQIEQAVAKFMAATSAPGISVAVLENGEETWSSGFGMADLENFVPATPSTLYRLGSISKSVTATAAMELWERGKFDLDAPVQRVAVPDTPIPFAPSNEAAVIPGEASIISAIRRVLP